MQDALASIESKTILVVAHRLSTVRSADSIVVLRLSAIYFKSTPDLMRYAAELMDRLGAINEDEACMLVKAWRSMQCRNASIVEFSKVLTGLLRCNTAPILLGAGQSGKGAGMYMVKYMIKEAYELAGSLSVLADARKHIDQYPSAASDSGSAPRQGKHFLQHRLRQSQHRPELFLTFRIVSNAF